MSVLKPSSDFLTPSSVLPINQTVCHLIDLSIHQCLSRASHLGGCMIGAEVGNGEDVHGACYHLGGRLDAERVTSGKSVSKGECAMLRGSQ